MKTAKRVIFCAAALIALSGLAFSASTSEKTMGGSMDSGSGSSTDTDSSSTGGSTGTDSGSSTGGSTGTDSGSSTGGSTGAESGGTTHDLEDRQSIPGGSMGTYSSSHGSKKGHKGDTW